MAEENADLFSAFAEDHAFLGRSFHELSTALRARNLPAAIALAQRLDREAGAHIAFEEEHFYPTLAVLLGEAEVERLRAEHQDGLMVIDHLCRHKADVQIPEPLWSDLLKKSERVETHIAECGDLFGAMGRISPADQEFLHAQLVEWRLRNPSWRNYAKTAARKPTDAIP